MGLFRPSLEEVRRVHEWMYVNYWHKDKDASNLAEVLKMQARNMAKQYDVLETSDYDGPVRDDGRATWVRVATYDDMPFKEITGYIDGEGLVAFFVLFIDALKESMESVDDAVERANG